MPPIFVSNLANGQPAYNNWLHEKIHRQEFPAQGMALIPIQDVEASVVELRARSEELGMLGGMLRPTARASRSSRRQALIADLRGSREARLRSGGTCRLTVQHWAWTDSSTYYPVHAWTVPSVIAIQAAGLLAHGSFEKFPSCASRFPRAARPVCRFFSTGSIVPIILATCRSIFTIGPVGGPKEGEKASDYLRRQIREGRIFVGFDVDDDGLGFAGAESGRERLSLAAFFRTKFSMRRSVETKSPACSSAKIMTTRQRGVWAATPARFYGLNAGAL